MRKFILIFATLFSLNASAQTEFSAGVMITVSGSLSLKEDVDGGLSVAPIISLADKKHSHHIMVAAVQNKEFEVNMFAQTLHTLSIGNDWDLYGFLQVPLGKGDVYGSVGIEKVMSLSEKEGAKIHGKLIPFFEVGTNFKGDTFFSLGFTIKPYMILKKK